MFMTFRLPGHDQISCSAVTFRQRCGISETFCLNILASVTVIACLPVTFKNRFTFLFCQKESTICGISLIMKQFSKKGKH